MTGSAVHVGFLVCAHYCLDHEDKIGPEAVVKELTETLVMVKRLSRVSDLCFLKALRGVFQRSAFLSLPSQCCLRVDDFDTAVVSICV